MEKAISTIAIPKEFAGEVFKAHKGGYLHLELDLSLINIEYNFEEGFHVTGITGLEFKVEHKEGKMETNYHLY